MRRFLRLSTLTLGAGALAFAVLAPSAGAGIREGAAPLTIVKTVSGPVPAGTTFTATLECEDEIISDGADGTDHATVTFDAAGQPTTPDTFSFRGPGSCTVTETATGGAATTTYASAGVEPTEEEAPEAGAAQEAPPICPTAGPQAGPIDVNIVFESQTATVTIHNTFTALEAAPQVVAQPAFTG